MVRGATPYGLRGTPLVIPDGTLENPAVRFGTERSGLYRESSEVIGFGIKKVRKLELSTPTTRIYNNLQVDGTSLQLGHATFNGNVLAHGQISTTANIHAATTISCNGVLSTAGPELLIESTNGISQLRLEPWSTLPASGRIKFDSPLPSGPQAFLDFQGAATAFGLGAAQGDLSLYTTSGKLYLGVQNKVRLILEAGAPGLRFMEGAGELGRLTSSGFLGLNTQTPQARLHVQTEGPAITISPPAAAFTNTYMQVMNNPISASANRFLQWGIAGAAGQFVHGTAVGDSAMTTASGGRLFLGALNTTKLILDAGTPLIQFMHGNGEVARFHANGALGIGILAPAARVHASSLGAGDGMIISAPTLASGCSPHYRLNETPSGSTRDVVLGLALRVNDYLGGLAIGDAVLMTSGTNAGRLVLGARNLPTQIFTPAGSVTFQLGAGGAQSFQVLKSTGAPALIVNDAGLSGSTFPADSIPGSSIMGGTVTAQEVKGNTLTHSNMAAQAIHNPLRTFIGPPSTPFDHVANSAWHDIPGLTTPLQTGIGGADPSPTDDFFYEMWAECSVAHSAGGRVYIRIIFLRQVDNAVIFADQSPPGAGGVAGGTTWPATSYFTARVHTAVTGIFQPGYFRVQILSPDGGTVRVFTNESRLRMWVSKR